MHLLLPITGCKVLLVNNIPGVWYSRWYSNYTPLYFLFLVCYFLLGKKKFAPTSLSCVATLTRDHPFDNANDFKEQAMYSRPESANSSTDFMAISRRAIINMFNILEPTGKADRNQLTYNQGRGGSRNLQKGGRAILKFSAAPLAPRIIL